MGSQLGQRASKTACLVRADSGTNLIKQGENVSRPIGSVAQLAVCSRERDALGSNPGWITIFGSPVTYSGSVWVHGWDHEQQKGRSRWYLCCSEQIRGRIYLCRGKYQRSAKWLHCSVVSRIASGPGFDSRSGHEYFLPCDIWWPVTQRF